MAPIANPFNVDAATASEYELVRLPPQGGTLIGGFCGTLDSAHDWDERGVCVLKARKGFGKSHLLQVRSLRHRSSAAGPRTLFYPHGGHPRLLVDALSSLHVVVPRWLHGRESTSVWVDVWQLSILGLLAWITRARVAGLRGYADWFGSLEALDQVHLENRPDAPDRSQPNAMLTWFMGRVLERLGLLEFKLGADELKHGLYHGGTEWAIAIKSNLDSAGKTRIAMYLDAPDELVALDQPGLWRNVQQGLVLAIWKFAKSSAWSRTLNIYASVRSEAFGSGQDHPDVSQALGLAIPLSYGDHELEAMVNDRIRQADPAGLALPLTGATTPLAALCGFEIVVHEDRNGTDEGRFTEPIFDSMLRHTRHVPRELVAIVGAVYHSDIRRTPEVVRRAVNAQASANISSAIEHSLLGWNDAIHRLFALSLSSEALSGSRLFELARAQQERGDELIKFFVKHGLIGTAEPAPERHRHCYVQRFSYDEVHGHESSVSINKDYFFVHPALKEWVRSQNEGMGPPFGRLDSGAVGDMLPFESMGPLIRLGVAESGIYLDVREVGKLAIGRKNSASDPLKFLFVSLWACRNMRRPNVLIAEIRDLWSKLKQTDILKTSLKIHLPSSDDDLTMRVRDWAKKVNSEHSVRELQARMFFSPRSHSSQESKSEINVRRSVGFISVSGRSGIGVQSEVIFNQLPIDEVDWEVQLQGLINRIAKQS